MHINRSEIIYTPQEGILEDMFMKEEEEVIDSGARCRTTTANYLVASFVLYADERIDYCRT